MTMREWCWVILDGKKLQIAQILWEECIPGHHALARTLVKSVVMTKATMPKCSMLASLLDYENLIVSHK